MAYDDYPLRVIRDRLWCLWIRCDVCGNTVTWRCEDLDSDVTVGALASRLRCGQCGARGQGSITVRDDRDARSRRDQEIARAKEAARPAWPARNTATD